MSMHESATENENRTALPLLPITTPEEQPSASSWHDWTPVTPLPDSPEPTEPQGEYSETPSEATREIAPVDSSHGPVELLAPAGGPDAAFAAFHYGADAIYLGLKKFSARAEAENFTLEELDEITAYAHSLDAAPPCLRHHQHADPPGRVGRSWSKPSPRWPTSASMP